jgi:hypothetical protein
LILTQFSFFSMYSLVLIRTRLTNQFHKCKVLWKPASSRGLGVRAEDSWLRGRGYKPPLRRPFSGTIHLDQKPGAKIGWKLTWHCCICCNPAKGRRDFEDGWLIKSSIITKRMKWSLSANQDQIPTKKYCRSRLLLSCLMYSFS